MNGVKAAAAIALAKLLFRISVESDKKPKYDVTQKNQFVEYLGNFMTDFQMNFDRYKIDFYL